MIKGLVEKINKNKAPVTDPEILELRKKFSALDNTDKGPVVQPSATAQPALSQQPVAAPVPVHAVQPTAQPAPAVAPEKTLTPAVQTKHSVPTAKDVKVKLIDVEQAEQDERMTNMIMEQIKELIEIDDNLNNKIKDIGARIDENKRNIEQFSGNHEKAMSRMDMIEKNMEKFMALYEVVTNQYNPFVDSKMGAEVQPPAEAPAATPEPTQVPVVPAQPAEPTPEPQSIQQSVPVETTQATVEDQLEKGATLLQLVENRINDALTQFKLSIHNEVNVNIEAKVNEMVQKIEASVNQQLNDTIKHHIEEEVREKLTKMISGSSPVADNTTTQPAIAPVAAAPTETPDVSATQPVAPVPAPSVDSAPAQAAPAAPAPPAPVAPVQPAPPAQPVPAAEPQPVAAPPAEVTPAAPVPVAPAAPPEAPAQPAAEPQPPPEQPPQEGLHPHEEVHEDNYFWLPDGQPIKSLAELVKVLRTMDDATYSEHVNEEKNDFAEWVEHVLEKPSVAHMLRGKSRQAILSALEHAL